jgi:hypothetical protein
MKIFPQLVVVSLLLPACAAAQSSGGSATVQSVKMVQDGSDVRVEITLNSPVTPTVDTAFQPDRILLDFPETTSSVNTPSVSVNQNGVRRVRTGQHSTSPLITRVVVDLDRAHPYTLKTEGNRVILTVGPAENARKSLHGAPVAATSGNLIGVFRRKHDEPVPVPPDNTPYTPPPAPPATASGPAFEPPSANSSASTLPAPPPAVAPGPTPKVASQAPAPPPEVAQSPVATASKADTAASMQPPVVTPAATQPVSKPAEIAVSNPKPAEALAPATVEPVVVKPAENPPAATVPAPAPIETAKVEAAPPTAAPVAKAEETPAPTAVTEVPASAGNSETAKAEEPAPAPAAAGATATPAPESTVIENSSDPSLRTVFKVKYVAEGVAYLDGGRTQGLSEGMKLEVKDDATTTARQGQSVNSADPHVIAELEVTAVADTSAVTEIHTPKRSVKVGDLAYLSSGDTDSLVQQRALSATRQYPAVISFTQGDTLDEEVRQEVPKPPLPSVNRARGRIGLDAIETISHGTSSVTSSDVGVVFRGDVTRIGGTYWNLSGYWRGRLTKESAAAQQTLQETLNRTYHLNMTYDNPNSILVAGFGRLYLPWAPSLDTIDGGYFGVRLSRGSTLGMFGGSTPDPASWDYSPNRALAGSFINFEGGDWNAFHYSATTGAGVEMVKWTIDRPFVFVEDQISYKRIFAIYESAQLDSPRGSPATPAPGPGLGRDFLTFRINPHPRFEINLNYNYFRDVPTFDPTLIGTGLLDKYLFQGFTAGARVEVVNQVWVSTQLGRSDRSGDAQASLNQMYGLTFGRVPWLNARADLHYSRFNSSFGTGAYEAFSLSRQMGERLRLEMLLGEQRFASAITANNRSRFLTGTIETTLGPHYYLQSNFTTNRGDLSYDQMMFSMGYRFDSKRRGQ